jgi:4-alpha-glucanotransferase
MDASHLMYSPASKHWEHIGIISRHGIAIPLFSIHSNQSNGIGEFPDIHFLVDWCQAIGLTVIQLLPLNDTGSGSSPYSALSAFALNPIYLGLSSLPFLEDYPQLREELNAIPKFSGQLRIEYEHVRNNKDHFLVHYLEKVGIKISKSEAYQSFYQSATWLEGYALFRTLKKRYQWVQWEIWPKEIQNPSLADFKNLLSPEEQVEMQNHCLLQFLCDQQLCAAKNYATERQVLLMGDMPILIDRDSADVWLHRSLFDLTYAAGAPPDMFTDEGQNWGFPIYNWEALAHTNYQWWVDRLQWSCRYFHLYRIDHIVGFFRIWSIPMGLKGKDGSFIPADQTTWVDHGQRLMLMMLNACDILPIGEDLGVIPTEVRQCMRALGICGTRVMRWERHWLTDQTFIAPDDYLLESMTTVSTHDSETLQQWWQNHPEEAQLLCQSKGWSYHPILSRDYHLDILWDSHHTKSLFHINPLQEYLTLVPGLSWPNLDDERVNIPGLFSEKNWSYRMRLTLEELIQQFTLSHVIQELIL